MRRLPGLSGGMRGLVQRNLLVFLLLHIFTAACQDTSDPHIRDRYFLGVPLSHSEVGDALVSYLTLALGQRFNPAVSFERVSISEDLQQTDAELDFTLASPLGVVCLCAGGRRRPVCFRCAISGPDGDPATARGLEPSRHADPKIR